MRKITVTYKDSDQTPVKTVKYEDEVEDDEYAALMLEEIARRIKAGDSQTTF